MGFELFGLKLGEKDLRSAQESVGKQLEEESKDKPKSIKRNSIASRMSIRIPGTNRGINVPLALGVAAIYGASVLGGGGGDASASQEGITIEPVSAGQTMEGNGASTINTSTRLEIKQNERVNKGDVQKFVDAAPDLYKKKAEKSIPAVTEALRRVGIDSYQVTAYLLATSEPESNLDLEMEEIDGESQAKDLGYDGGENFFGRGFMPLTHEDNYRRMSQALPKYFPEFAGIDLVKNPELAKRWDISAAIAAVYMKEWKVAEAVMAGNLDRARELVYGKITDNDSYGRGVKNSIDIRYVQYLKAVQKEYMIMSINSYLDQLLASQNNFGGQPSMARSTP